MFVLRSLFVRRGRVLVGRLWLGVRYYGGVREMLFFRIRVFRNIDRSLLGGGVVGESLGLWWGSGWLVGQLGDNCLV